jgi:hypothetical protein
MIQLVTLQDMWFLERKFSEWNLKHISENINRNENETIINITANSYQRKLIDDLINGFCRNKTSKLLQQQMI